MSGGFFSQYTITFEENETIYSQGEPGNCMFVVKEGQVETFKMAHNVREKADRLEKGDFFGELSILEHCPRYDTACALTDVVVVVIHRNTFVKMLKANMEIAIRILQKLSAKLRHTEEKLDDALSRLAKQENQNVQTTRTTPKLAKNTVAKLIAVKSKRIFELTKDRNLAGRYDPVTCTKPEIDLTHEDDNRSVSRRHAVILRKGNQFYVQEEMGVLNGTFVDGKKISSSEELVPIQNLDTLNIGMVAFRFYIEESDT